MGNIKLVYVDHKYDRDNATNGESRFTAYVNKLRREFADWEDMDRPTSPEKFAAAAWRVATGPIMSPGYARIRPDLHKVTAHPDTEEGGLYVELQVPLQHHLLRTGQMDSRWADWSTDRFHEDLYASYYEPRGNKDSVLTTATVRISGKNWPLPEPVSANSALDLLVDRAKDAVDLIVSRINQEGGPVIANLLGESL